MGVDDSLSVRMAEAARELHDQVDSQATLDSAAQVAVAEIPGADAAGIALLQPGKRIHTLAATAEWVTVADRLQHKLGEGPCLDAVWQADVVHATDLMRAERWPTWGPEVAQETGVRSLMSFRLYTRERTLGALNVYSRVDDAFDTTDLEDGIALAAQISVAVAAAQEAQSLVNALDSRTLTSQAVGMLMERFTLTPDAAFALLIRVASETNTKIRDLAVELTTTGKLRERPE